MDTEPCTKHRLTSTYYFNAVMACMTNCNLELADSTRLYAELEYFSGIPGTMSTDRLDEDLDYQSAAK